jgi:hypothetical protein
VLRPSLPTAKGTECHETNPHRDLRRVAWGDQTWGNQKWGDRQCSVALSAHLGDADPGYAFPAGMFRPGGSSAREGVDRGAVWEFLIEPTAETISLPGSRTLECCTLAFLSTHRSQALFVAMTEH